MAWDLLITHIKGLVQVRNTISMPLTGADMAELPVLENAYLAVREEKIVDYGSMDDLSTLVAGRVIDATGRFVFPSFVDSHTHLVFAVSREEEFVMKIRGDSYEDIAARGGGILNSVKKLRTMSEDSLYQLALARAHEVIRTGTGAIEIKSGYGLTVEDELKMLRVARRLGRETPLLVKTTFLGAHAVPDGINKADYIRLVIEEMIPAVAEQGLADYIDVFCEKNFFTFDETVRIAEEGKKRGMQPRLHANQLHCSGGVQAAVKVGAVSADHLESIGEEEIVALQNSKVMPTALPGAAFFLNMPFPPAKAIMRAGLPLAIASDYNPGSAPTGNMPLMVALACIKMNMTPAEAINATTINTAAALNILDLCGSITLGKKANFFITHPILSPARIPYSYGSNMIDSVILEGKLL